MERPHDHRDLLGGCAAVMWRKPGERQRPSTKVTIRRVPMRSSLGISRDGHVSGDRQRKTIRGFRQKRNLALDLLPYFGTFGKSEDELAVDQVCPRGPSLAKEVDRANLNAGAIRLHALPIDGS